MENIVSKLLAVDTSLEYIADVLAVGGASTNAVSDCGVDLDAIHVLAPEEVSTDRLLDLVHGGLLARGAKISDGRTEVQAVPTTIRLAASILYAELMQCARPKLWIHEPLLTEVELAERDLPYQKVRDTLYLVFTDDFDEERVAELLRYSLLSWHFLAFVTESSDRIESVDELICAARFMVIGAYDGESFLFGRRKSPEERS